MALAAEIHQAALAEAEAATEWYRTEAGQDVALRFAADVAAALRVVSEAPERAAVRSDGTRARRLDDFPYVVVYDEADGRVRVLAVAHTSRRPGYWSDRR